MLSILCAQRFGPKLSRNPQLHILQKSQTRNHQCSQCFELYQTVMKLSFYVLLKILDT